MTVKEVFPLRLREAREMRKITQYELSKKSGCHFTSIAQFETGARLPSIENLLKLAMALKVSSDYLLGAVDNISFFEKLTIKQVETIGCLIKHWEKKITDDNSPV